MKKQAQKKKVGTEKQVTPVKPVKRPVKAKAPRKKDTVLKEVAVGPSPKGEVQPQKTASGPYEEIRKMLLRQKKAILVESGVLLENTLNPASEVFPDWTDQASAEMDQNFVLRLREREQQLLKKIEDAIERIDGEAFGICEFCGGEISLKRLRARPVTTLCIECKTKQELDEKMRQ